MRIVETHKKHDATVRITAQPKCVDRRKPASNGVKSQYCSFDEKHKQNPFGLRYRSPALAFDTSVRMGSWGQVLQLT
jgi:hypothetical protein